MSLPAPDEPHLLVVEFASILIVTAGLLIFSALVKAPLLGLADFNKTISRDYEALMDNGMALRATIIIDPEGVVQHASYNADLLGRSVAETLRLVQALQTGERCPVEWKPGAKTLGKPA